MSGVRSSSKYASSESTSRTLYPPFPSLPPPSETGRRKKEREVEIPSQRLLASEKSLHLGSWPYNGLVLHDHTTYRPSPTVPPPPSPSRLFPYSHPSSVPPPLGSSRRHSFCFARAWVRCLFALCSVTLLFRHPRAVRILVSCTSPPPLPFSVPRYLVSGSWSLIVPDSV